MHGIRGLSGCSGPPTTNDGGVIAYPETVGHGPLILIVCRLITATARQAHQSTYQNRHYEIHGGVRVRVYGYTEDTKIKGRLMYNPSRWSTERGVAVMNRGEVVVPNGV